MKPNTDLVKILTDKKCKVAYKNIEQGKAFYLMVDYGALTKPKPGSGLEVWGRTAEIFDKVNATVHRFYPKAELTSQNGNYSAVFRIQYY